MFKPLLQILRERRARSRTPDQPLPLPLDLSSDEIDALSAIPSASWTVYLQALDKLTTLESETLLSSRDSALLNETRGLILGLRRAGTLVDEILIKVKEVHAFNDKLRTNAALRAAAEHRVAALYGSSAWPGSTSG